ncbi:hypothetical protein [Rickettsiella massiliensis]|uniref:hypothetical protein n=1 Tax=Rickettsiella massiliensis TaxID=676517 RepID=UPI0012EABCA6|nr:hypothetical protein [Rickettsiella massiliensis]
MNKLKNNQTQSLYANFVGGEILNHHLTIKSFKKNRRLASLTKVEKPVFYVKSQGEIKMARVASSAQSNDLQTLSQH